VIFYSSSESLSEVSHWILPLFARDGAAAGGKASLNAGKEVGNTALRSRSDLTSLEYFSDFSALVSAIMAY
jgi:hypothetical protein